MTWEPKWRRLTYGYNNAVGSLSGFKMVLRNAKNLQRHNALKKKFFCSNVANNYWYYEQKESHSKNHTEFKCNSIKHASFETLNSNFTNEWEKHLKNSRQKYKKYIKKHKKCRKKWAIIKTILSLFLHQEINSLIYRSVYFLQNQI